MNQSKQSKHIKALKTTPQGDISRIVAGMLGYHPRGQALQQLLGTVIPACAHRDMGNHGHNPSFRWLLK